MLAPYQHGAHGQRPAGALPRLGVAFTVAAVLLRRHFHDAERAEAVIVGWGIRFPYFPGGVRAWRCGVSDCDLNQTHCLLVFLSVLLGCANYRENAVVDEIGAGFVSESQRPIVPTAVFMIWPVW
jgi:hypothetical protein